MHQETIQKKIGFHYLFFPGSGRDDTKVSNGAVIGIVFAAIIIVVVIALLLAVKCELIHFSSLIMGWMRNRTQTQDKQMQTEPFCSNADHPV